MKILDRDLHVVLIQNTGNGILGNTMDISDKVKDINNSGFSLDDRLQQASIANMTIKCIDAGNSIWEFIENGLAYSGNLYPAFLVVILGNKPIFYGVVDLKNIQKNQTAIEKSITINSSEWYQMLAKVDLDGDVFKRSYPVVNNGRPASGEVTGSISKFVVICGYIWESQYPEFLTRVWFDKAIVGSDFCIPGDRFTSSLYPSYTFGVTSAIEKAYPTVFPGKTFIEVQLSGFKWPKWDGCTEQYLDYLFNQGECLTATFQRLASPVSEQSYFVVEEAITVDDKNPVYEIALNTVAGLIPGDKLDLRSTAARKGSTTFTILDVDTESAKIILSESVSEDLVIGDLLYYGSDTVKELVFEDVRDIIRKANSISACDFSRFSPATLSSPALSWLPYRVDTGTEGSSSLISSPCDIQPSLSGQIQVKGASGTWQGSPEDGWTEQEQWTDFADWTDTLADPPSLLMPIAAEIEKYSLGRNKNTSLMNWSTKAYVPIDDPADPGDTSISIITSCYDYSNMYRYVYYRSGQDVEGQRHTWNGTAWINPVSLAWAEQSQPNQIMSFGNGSNLYCLTSNNEILMISNAGVIRSVQQLPEKLKDGVLKRTVDGAYILTKSGYGKITCMGADVTIKYVAITNDKKINIVPSTFCAYGSNGVFCLATTSYVDENEKIKYEVYSLLLSANPEEDKPEEAIRFFEKISDGSPRIARAFYLDNRIIGLLGGRLFQVSNTMSTIIERYSVEGLTASQVIENVCQIHNCYSFGNASGMLEVVSRDYNSAPVDLPDSVGIKSQTEFRNSEFFLSPVSVSGNSEDVWASEESGIAGGTSFTIENHPFLTTTSQCRSVALSYVSFFGRPRKKVDQTWIYMGTGEAPFESYKPNQIIRIQGKTWYLLRMDIGLKNREASVSLLEV